MNRYGISVAFPGYENAQIRFKIMRVDYVNKVLTLLGDRSKFSKLDSNALELCLKRGNKIIRLLSDELLKENRNNEEVYQQLCSPGSTPVFFMVYLKFISRIALPDPFYRPSVPTTTNMLSFWCLFCNLLR